MDHIVRRIFLVITMLIGAGIALNVVFVEAKSSIHQIYQIIGIVGGMQIILLSLIAWK